MMTVSFVNSELKKINFVLPNTEKSVTYNSL